LIRVIGVFHPQTNALPIEEKEIKPGHTDIDMGVFRQAALCIGALSQNRIFPLVSSAQLSIDYAQVADNLDDEELYLVESFHHIRLFLNLDHHPACYTRNQHSTQE
jgi:hypothetical protein